MMVMLMPKAMLVLVVMPKAMLVLVFSPRVLTSLLCVKTVTVIAGDFNCHKESRFYSHLQNLVADNKLSMSDNSRLVDAVTYCNDAGTACSWIDQVLCSDVIDDCISNVAALDSFVSSDHKPLAVTFKAHHNRRQMLES